jgi:hypothetical protein
MKTCENCGETQPGNSFKKSGIAGVCEHCWIMRLYGPGEVDVVDALTSVGLNVFVIDENFKFEE